jgi:hypothetical protein
VLVPAGLHTVEVYYRPVAFDVGLAVSVFTVCGLSGVLLFGVARREE